MEVKLLEESARVPTRGSELAAGYDLYSCETASVPSRGRGVIRTGIAIAVPADTYGRVAPRSGLAVRSGISTGAGVIDADYRGEVGVVLFNHSDEEFHVGDRIAQLILEKIVTPPVKVVKTLGDTERGSGGFGSTGA